jgi:2-amino-4-hydroxy-6-hydroxymethyldihydropteridine diphosphokinase
LPLAYIGVGANLDDAAGSVEAAIARLAEAGTVRVRSRLYRTKPWGEEAQPDFVNAVAGLDTELRPRELLAALQRLERELGRTPSYRWGPRRIDLDILTYGDERVDDEDLKVPHPRLAERAFVLVPLAELDAEYAPLRDALSQDERDGVRPLSER